MMMNIPNFKINHSSIILALFTCFIMMGSGCTASFLSLQQRISVEKKLKQVMTELQKTNSLPVNASQNVLSLVKYVYQQVPQLRARIQAQSIEELSYVGLKRVGQVQVGDLVVFRDLSHSIRVAIVSDVKSDSQYMALSIRNKTLFPIKVNTMYPNQRYRKQQVINSFVRKISPSDQAPFLYLAAESIQVVRALF